MKSLLSFSSLLVLVCMVACKKDPDAPGSTTKLLASYTSILQQGANSYKDTVLFDYNSNGQIILSEGVEDRSTVSISGSQLHYNEFRKTENRTTADATFTLNAQGNVGSGQGSFSYNAGSPYTSQFTFTYDAAGNLLKRTDSRSDGNVWSYEFTWTNGDIMTIKWILNNALYLTQSIEYYPDLKDKIKLDWDKFLSANNSFFGNSCKHLRKHISTVFAPGSTVTQEYTFEYDLDSDGYPSILTTTGITSPSTNVITYHYK